MNKKKGTKRKSGQFNPITEHLIKEKSISGPLLMSVFSCMAWGDGVSSNRACAMAHNAIKLITTTGKYNVVIFRETLDAMSVRRLILYFYSQFSILPHLSIYTCVKDVYNCVRSAKCHIVHICGIYTLYSCEILLTHVLYSNICILPTLNFPPCIILHIKMQ